ncbi:MAG: adenosylcobinamide-GDP ribazoletransferase [Clostridium sp.]
MKRLFENLLLMIQLLTRIPINKNLPCENDDFKRGGSFFFVIGIIIGVVQLTIFEILTPFLSLDMIVIILIIIEVIITGGFHIDGLGDTCDGFFAFKGKEKIIDIMKDSRIGTFACIAIIIDLGIKFIGYKEIILSFGSFVILIIPIISRVAISLISYIGKPAKENGTGNLFINTMKLSSVIINFLGFIVISIFILPIRRVIIVLMGVIIMVIGFNKYCCNKINGITGDSLGAMNEIAIIGVMVLLCANI